LSIGKTRSDCVGCEAEIRSAQHEVLLEAAKLALSGEPGENRADIAGDGGAHDSAEEVNE